MRLRTSILSFSAITIVLSGGFVFPVAVLAQDAAESADPTAPIPAEYKSELIADCALEDPASGRYCNDVNDLLLDAIIIGEFLFKIAGSLAFFFIVIGGFTLLLSMGNAEKAKKAWGLIFGAVIGLLISLSAYLLIDFVLDSLGVIDEFRGIG